MGPLLLFFSQRGGALLPCGLRDSRGYARTHSALDFKNGKVFRGTVVHTEPQAPAQLFRAAAFPSVL